MPYEHWGACPFECCTYGTWEATKELAVYSARSVASKVAFKLKKGEKIQATTGVVVTQFYGVTKILQPIELGYTPEGKTPELALKPGDIVYTLHYEGEASDFFWYRGKVYSDQIDVPDDAWGNPPNGDVVEILSRPKYDWWAKIQNKAGAIGWSNQTDAFAHADACE